LQTYLRSVVGDRWVTRPTQQTSVTISTLTEIVFKSRDAGSVQYTPFAFCKIGRRAVVSPVLN